jgi:mannan polymerase II complex MNN11 subunit
VQWHPTILSKLAVIPQRIINAYNKENTKDQDGAYVDGDFVIRFPGCENNGRDCEKQADALSKRWRAVFDSRQ